MSANPKLFRSFIAIQNGGGDPVAPSLTTDITLRDLFMVSAPPAPNDYLYKCHHGVPDEEPVAREVRWRMEYADAMLAERAKEKP